MNNLLLSFPDSWQALICTQRWTETLWGLTLYTPKSVSTFSLLFSIQFLWYWQEELVKQLKHFRCWLLLEFNKFSVFLQEHNTITQLEPNANLLIQKFSALQQSNDLSSFSLGCFNSLKMKIKVYYWQHMSYQYSIPAEARMAHINACLRAVIRSSSCIAVLYDRSR